MNLATSFIAVVALFLIGTLAAWGGLEWVVGVAVPYAAVALLLGGLIHRVVGWLMVPVPFRIPTSCGQQQSLAWIKPGGIDNPHTRLGVIGRVVLEVLFFRSLLRNTRAQMVEGHRLVYASNLWLWLAGIVMHWSLAFILIRHLRLLLEPVPVWVTFVERLDGFLELGLPAFYISSIAFLAALLFLLGRRLVSPQLRYISLIGDYFPLFLLLGIALSGLCVRHFVRTDLVGVKELALGLTGFRPSIPADVSSLFYGHLFLVSVLLAYFPFSKLAHMAGVFLSPTRNMVNNNRRVRHINPWNYPVKVHGYEEYEDELRDKMKTAGIPVERQ